MREFFIFDMNASGTEAERGTRTSIVFCPDPIINETILKANLKHHFETCLPPDRLLLIGTERCKDRMDEVANAPKLTTALQQMTRWVDPPTVEALWQDSLGRMIGANNTEVAPELVKRIAQSGLFHLFKLRGGLLECGPAFHYRKPSGAHCDKFIRTANVLVHGAEISFISFWLLPLLTEDIIYLYTDTAAINAVAYAAILLKQRLDPTCPTPVITSFGSYDGLEMCHFQHPSLIFISASTSGHLEDILVHKRHINRHHITTIYGLGKLHAAARVLCNLGEHGITPVENQDPNRCTLCRRSVPLIGITGEQFLPETPAVRSELLTISHAPPWLKGFMRDFVELDVVRCNHPPVPADEPVRHVYFDLASIFDGTLQAPEFGRNLERIILQSTPAALKRIVHLNDPASRALARRVLDLTTAFRKAPNDISVISASELYERAGELTTSEGAAVVVAGAIVTGRSVLAVSQMLRRVQKNGLVQYLVGLGKTNSPERYKNIRTNAQYGDTPGSNDFRTVSNIFLPTDSFLRDTPWEEERKHLAQMAEHFHKEPVYQELLNTRQQALDNEEQTGGLRHHLFWETPFHGTPLRLRPGFAFWHPGYNPEKVSQAEVYLTMLCVLHAAREGHTGSAAWVQHEHERVLLSPYNFTRFNDGIIQASLLRAAYPPELDYTVKDDESATMMGVLEYIVANFGNDAGESTIEILFAISTGKLRLHRQHTDSLLRRLEAQNPPPVITMFIQYIRAVSQF